MWDSKGVPNEWQKDFKHYQTRLTRRLGAVLAASILLLFPVFVVIDFYWIPYPNSELASYNTLLRLPAYLAAALYLLLLAAAPARWMRPALIVLSITLIASMSAMFVLHKITNSDHIHYASHALTMSLIIVAVASSGARQLTLIIGPPLLITVFVLILSGFVPSYGAVYPVYLATATAVGLIISEMLHHGHVSSFLALKKTEHHATTDPLTGLPNRRAMHLRLNTAQAQILRSNSPASLMMADLDHFKRVNDDYGHDVGDEVLIELAQRMQSMLRASDAVARWGGEEFLIMLFGSDQQNGLAVAETLRRLVSDTPFATSAGNLTITISIGVAQLNSERSIEGTIKAADDALYKAKKNGRNQTQMAD